MASPSPTPEELAPEDREGSFRWLVREEPDPAVRAAWGEQGLRFSRAIRSRRGFVSLLACLALLALETALPGTEAVLRVRPSAVLATLGAMVLGVLHAQLAWARRGPSPWYFAAVVLEDAVISLGGLRLIWLSGNSGSVFWLWHFVVVFSSPAPQTRRALLLVYGLGPLALAAAFALVRRDATSAVASLGSGVVGLVIFVQMLRAQRLAAVADVARDALRIERERERIARDLHDGVGSSLTAALWDVRSADGRIGRDDATRLEARLLEGVAALRDVVWAADAQGCTAGALRDRLHERARDLCGAGVKVTVALDGAETASTAPVPAPLALDVLRVVQECATNVRKYANASRFDVRLAHAHDGATLLIEDDGVGVTRECFENSRGGLRNMAARAREHGGAAHLEDAPKGTRLRIVLGRR